MTGDHDYYAGDSGKSYQLSVHGDVIRSPRVFRAKATLAAHRYFRELPLSARILEYGVGVGTNLATLEHPVRHGFDIGEFARQKASEAGVEVFASLDEIPRGHYDLVLCRHVLEHVTEPLSLLNDLKSFLAPEGQLLLIIPVEGTTGSVRRLPEPDVSNHLYAWGPQQIVNLLRAAELAPVSHQIYWYSAQAKLSPLLGLAGIRFYSALVTLAGHIRRQRELAIWARTA